MPATPQIGYVDTKMAPGCAELYDRYLKDNDITIVLDHEISKSFCIRDRGCIETIVGCATTFGCIHAIPCPSPMPLSFVIS